MIVTIDLGSRSMPLRVHSLAFHTGMRRKEATTGWFDRTIVLLNQYRATGSEDDWRVGGQKLWVESVDMLGKTGFVAEPTLAVREVAG